METKWACDPQLLNLINTNVINYGLKLESNVER